VSFRVIEPRAAEIPVVVEVPHAGLGLDALTVARDAAVRLHRVASERRKKLKECGIAV